jgi:hypothetical protein
MSIQSARLHNSSAGMTALPYLEADRRGPICALTAVNSTHAFVSRDISVSRVEIDDDHIGDRGKALSN